MRVAPDELSRLMGERTRHTQDYQKVLANRDDEVDRLWHSIGPGSEKWAARVDERDRANSEFEAIAGQLGRPVNRQSLPRGTFYALAIGLAIVETPVNKFLFDVALQSSNVASYAVAFAVATFLLIAAHTAGKLSRQIWSEYRSRFYVSNIVIATTIMVILLGVVGILTIGRAEFSAAAIAVGVEGLFSSVGDKISASGGVIRALAHSLSDTSALVLVSVNVTSILVAFLLGYFAHDPDKHFDKAFERHRNAKRALERCDRLFKAGSNQARERARIKLDDINGLYTAASAAIVTQKSARGLAIDADDKLALPDQDTLLRRVRSHTHFTYEEDEAAPVGSDQQTSSSLDSLIDAGANITRVPARDPK